MGHFAITMGLIGMNETISHAKSDIMTAWSNNVFQVMQSILDPAITLTSSTIAGAAEGFVVLEIS
jgi:hypothetical protein